MEYRDHRKSFVMMTEQNRAFAMDRHRKCKGYLKIETGNGKGTMRVGVENFCCFEKRQYAYKVILFGRKKGKLIFKVLGEVPINKKGKGEIYLRFHPEDVDGKGSRFSEFSMAVVVAASQVDPREVLHPVLRGTLEHKDPPFQGGERVVERYNLYYCRHLLEGCRNIENKLEIYDKIVPFKEDQTKAEWRRIVNISKFPLLSKDGQYAISRYRHFIFGTGEVYYFIGVPGRYLEREQPEGGESGFVLWQPILGAERYEADQEGASLESRQIAYGYWIAAIDKKTGFIEKFYSQG